MAALVFNNSQTENDETVPCFGQQMFTFKIITEHPCPTCLHRVWQLYLVILVCKLFTRNLRVFLLRSKQVAAQTDLYDMLVLITQV